MKIETEAGGGGGEPSKTTSEAAPIDKEAEADKVMIRIGLIFLREYECSVI